MKQTIGILGGMGPLATCDIMEKIIRLTKADSDQEHFHLVVDCNTEISDRTAAILQGGPTPVPQMVQSAVKLQAMGADVIIMPCNTAHYFYDQITPFISIPFLHMIRETAKELKRRNVKKAGLLATTGTIKTGIYHREMEAAGIELTAPDGAAEDAIMDLIYRGVKADDPNYQPDQAKVTIDELLKQGADCLILGCTELPIAVQKYSIDCPCADPTLIVAQAAIDFFA